jgi:hypothetical protein
MWRITATYQCKGHASRVVAVASLWGEARAGWLQGLVSLSSMGQVYYSQSLFGVGTALVLLPWRDAVGPARAPGISLAAVEVERLTR